MKLRLTLAAPGRGGRDVALACDVTATVGDAARALIRSGATGDAGLEELAERRRQPVTLRARPGAGDEALLLDPMSPLSASGLRSGWIVEPTPEFGGGSSADRRAIETAGLVEVATGLHAGAVYSLVAGINSIGRDPGCRVHLGDPSVSRRHAQIEISAAGGSPSVVVRDLGSANGVILDGTAVRLAPIHRPCELTLGEVVLRVRPGPPPSRAAASLSTPPSAPATVPTSALSHRILHTRSPRVAPHFPASERELPEPPAQQAPSRIPVLAALAPMMMGAAMYLVTRSPMSLLMVAFSPLMMIGSWLDGRLGGRRRSRRERARFEECLAVERDELRRLREREIEVRAAETPTPAQISAAIVERGELLWTRRAEHRSFLEVRLGDGRLPSRTACALPRRGASEAEEWAALRGVADEFRDVAPVPVIERLGRCGSLGVAGEADRVAGLTRALILQIAGLHSPGEVALACFASPGQGAEWGWLKWLPHVDPVGGPLPVWQLADSPASAARLLVALETLLEGRRSARASTVEVRSHLDPESRNDEGHGEAVERPPPALPAVVVLVLDAGLVDPSRLIELAESGPDAGIHLIWAAPRRAALPAACRTFVETTAQGAIAGFVRSGALVPLARPEHVGLPAALDLARRLSPVEDSAARVLDESDLPRSVHLRDLHGVDLLGGAAAIARAWAASGSIASAWRRGEEREAVALAAVVGQGPDGPVSLDLRAHGPHALVGGTTGAGKSEFLQTWIMSLAAGIGPDRISFLLVDYKGGAAFAECVELPHTVGLVTDLGPHLVRRALASLRAELRRREELLAHHGAKDLVSMERRSDPAAPPALVIVIDEFAALAREVPEFVDGVIDVAQRGRSLGLHLIMATQRPAGVIGDNLRANTNLRVALRMADEADSGDVIGTADAAFFDLGTPGRAAVKVGPGRIAHFQTGYLGGRASDAPRAAEIEIRSLGFSEGDPWDVPPEPQPAPRRARPPRDIECLRDGIVAAAREAGIAAPRRPWLDELPEALSLGGLWEAAEGAEDPAARRDAAVIGLLDDPAAQAQRPAAIDFDEAGSVAFLGASGTGKTTALLSLAASLSRAAERFPVQLYGLDAAGGALGAIRALPTVGAVAPLADAELVARVLRRVRDAVSERGSRYAAARAGDLPAYRRTAGGGCEPRILLLIDGFAAFRQHAETLGGTDASLRQLGEIMAGGRAVGVHVAVTADRPSAVPAALAAGIQQRIVFRLANPGDYAGLGLTGDALEAAAPGRAIRAGDDRELQIGLIGARGAGGIGNARACAGRDLAEQAAGIEALAAELRDRGIARTPEVVNAPETIPLGELPVSFDGAPVYGIDTRTFEPATMPSSGLAVISGPAGSGQSTAILSCVRAVERWGAARGEPVERVLLTMADGGLRSAGCWDRVAYGEEEVRDLARELVRLLARPGRRTVIAIERPADAEGTEALPQLAALARAARRADALVLFEFESGTGGSIWELFSALRQPRWGLALQPDDGESQTPFGERLGRVRRADFPPGRGFAMSGGRVVPIHVALPDDPGVEGGPGPPASAQRAGVF